MYWNQCVPEQGESVHNLPVVTFLAPYLK